MDLAASMLDLLDDDRHLRTTVGVVTTVDNLTLLRWIRREALARRWAGRPRASGAPARCALHRVRRDACYPSRVPASTNPILRFMAMAFAFAG